MESGLDKISKDGFVILFGCLMKLSARSGSGCYYSKQLDCLWGKENAFLFRREEKVENLTYETISYFMLLLCYHHMKLSLMRCIRIYFKEG